MKQLELRIISGSLRGRKLKLPQDPDLRPMADRVRAALFSILGNAVPDRPFLDVFAGSGAVGVEALSRGAKQAIFVEKDASRVRDLLKHLKMFGVDDRAQVIQADAFRWVDKGAIPNEPVNLFLGPPYADFERHRGELTTLMEGIRLKIVADSVFIVQSETELPTDLLPDPENWDLRRYGRSQLAIWVKPRPELAQVQTGITEQHSENDAS